MVLWKDSRELKDCALKAVEQAIQEGKEKVEIKNSDRFNVDTTAIKECGDKLAIKQTTEFLRDQFKEYEIKSVLVCEGNLKFAISFSEGPCMMGYPLVWKITLNKKYVIS